MTTWDSFMARAVALAEDPRAPRGVNPRVGCVIVDDQLRIVGEGWHAGAGSPHAEVVALRDAGERAVGATAVVTLEPCRHHGRTGPCVTALVDAGIARVVFADEDPTSAAGGGAAELRAAGIEVISGIARDRAHAINREWSIAAARGLPYVTAKCAVSTDGRVAGPGGAPVALTGDEANRYSHGLRSIVQAIVVGAQTVVTDDPRLTIRHANIPVSGQPLRVVVGRRSLPLQARIFDASAPTVQIHDHDPVVVLRDLYSRGVRHVLLEGGPTLLRAFLEAGMVDELVWLITGVWLGSGPHALSQGSRLDAPATVVETRTLGEDVLVRALMERQVV